MVLFALVLTACDAQYNFTEENYQARDARVFIGGIDFAIAKSCSVDEIEFNAPPRRGRPVTVEVEVKDGQGNLVQKTDV